MDFQINLENLSNGINQYNSILAGLQEDNKASREAIDLLYEVGWAGEAKDAFDIQEKSAFEQYGFLMCMLEAEISMLSQEANTINELLTKGKNLSFS